MSLGVLIIAIALLGYVSNWLNWKYLNYPVIRFLYYIGTFIHEVSHIIFCILTGAKVSKISIFSKQPKIVHSKSRIPIIGQALISLAPIIGGMAFLYVINRFCLSNYFTIPGISTFKYFLTGAGTILSNFNLLKWQTWVMILLSFNMGAMIGPSLQDLKHIWFILIILLFIQWPVLANLCLLAILLILINILIQVVLIGIVFLVRKIKK
jgi:hypothetical protein